MKIEKTRSVAFSGHRTFKIQLRPGDLFANPADGDSIRERLRLTIVRLYGEGYRNFLCGMAEGFDLMAAGTVADLRKDLPDIRLTAVIPFPGQAAGFVREVREKYFELLAGCDDTVTVFPSYSAECFHRRNDYLLSYSDVLVCYYNGSGGGTAYTFDRALKAGLRIINLF